MTITNDDLARLIVALALIMTVAHGFGHLFARVRQPSVIGEICAGLVLGPTVLGAVAPDLESWVFPTDGPSATVLGAMYQLGLLLLMFCAGTQMRGLIERRNIRTVTAIAAFGIMLPFAAGLAAVSAFDFSTYEGPTARGASFLLVFALAIAVTSIPVISRIMFDLGLLETRFARIVLSVAVFEDIVVYVVLAVALGIAGGSQGSAFGLADRLGMEPGSAQNSAYYAVVTVLFLAVGFGLVPRLLSSILNVRWNLLKRRSPIGFHLVTMLVMSGAALFLSIVPLFGAFVAGIATARLGYRDAADARAAITNFSFAFFIPVYFAIVGLKLDLLNHFAVLFFVGFLLFACVAKTASVYLGARIGGEDGRSALNLAVAMNARGGPGIVLASVAFDAGIVDERFYGALVMLAIVTSLVAGAWLDRVAPSLRPAAVEPSLEAQPTAVAR